MNTKQLRQRVLDLAIHGKLVPQNPDDEPASVLLDRIKAEKEQLVQEGKIKKSKNTNDAIDEVPFDVPKGWYWCNIKDVTTKITDGTHHSPISYPEGKYLYVTAKNIKPNGIDLTEITFVDEVTHEEIYARCNPEFGDILYIKDGATTGIATINTIKEPFSLLSSVALIKPSREILNSYILYYLQSSLCYNSVRESMKGVGITRITLRQIETWSIPLPPLAEQQRIVSEVEKWFSVIDILESSENDLQQAIQKAKAKILDLAITGKLVEKAGEWEEKTLGEVCNYGKCVTTAIEDISTDSWVLELEDIEKDTARVINRKSLQERNIKGVRHKFNRGDVLYSKLRTYLNKVLVAPTDGYCTTEIIPITPNREMDSEFLCHVLRSKYFVDYTIQCGYGVKMPRLSTMDARKAKIPLPSLSEQHCIVEKIDELFAQLDKIGEALQ